MKSNLNKILNDNKTELTSRGIEKDVKYGSVIIKELPKDSIIIINGNDIEIVKEDKILRVDGNLELAGETVKILGNETDASNVEGLVTYSKLYQILSTSLGNFGGLIQFPLGLSEEVMTHDKIKTSKE